MGEKLGTESKKEITANNIVIAVLAVMLFSHVLSLANELYDLAATTLPDYWTMAKEGLIVAAFAFGLYHTIRGTLSSAKLGFVIVAYLVVFLLYDLVMESTLWRGSVPGDMNSAKNVLNRIFVYIQLFIGAVAAFFYFIKNSNKKIWVVLIVVVYALYIIRNVYCIVDSICYQVQNYYSEPISPFVTRDLAATLAKVPFWIVMIYQAIILYKKRKA
ncbi:MAG: hypothetical protein J5802_08765 [Butyrivibrio sp.]|nr:hypothetical protein [Butyrivibrio sp.]